VSVLREREVGVKRKRGREIQVTEGPEDDEPVSAMLSPTGLKALRSVSRIECHTGTIMGLHENKRKG